MLLTKISPTSHFGNPLHRTLTVYPTSEKCLHFQTYLLHNIFDCWHIHNGVSDFEIIRRSAAVTPDISILVSVISVNVFIFINFVRIYLYLCLRWWKTRNLFDLSGATLSGEILSGETICRAKLFVERNFRHQTKNSLISPEEYFAV